MNRRRFLASSAVAAGFAAPVTAWKLAGQGSARDTYTLPARPIPLPADGSVRTAFAIGPGVNVIDTAGPWEVFCDTAIARGRGSFEHFTVSGSTDPVEGNSGLAIIPSLPL